LSRASQNEFVDDLFLHGDDMHTVYSVTDETGTVVERYEYGDYGLPTALAPNGTTVRAESMINNTRMFTGRLHHPTPIAGPPCG